MVGASVQGKQNRMGKMKLLQLVVLKLSKASGFITSKELKISIVGKCLKNTSQG